MKYKFAAVLLSAILLTGCETAQVSNMMHIQGASDAMMQAAPASQIHYQVELKLYEDSAYAEDGQLLASYRAQVPVMTACLLDGTPLEDPQTDAGKRAVAAAETFNQRFSPWVSKDGFWEMTEAAQAELDFCRENGLLPMENYTLDLSCTVYQTDHLVSIAGLCYSYTGGAHPNTWELGWNFDLTTGTFLNGEMDFADRADFRAAVTEELLRQAEVTAWDNSLVPEDMYWPEYQTILEDWDSYTVYFDSTGMTVAFSPYELAPYACGTQKFHLSYDWIQPRLDAWGCQLLELDAPKS